MKHLAAEATKHAADFYGFGGKRAPDAAWQETAVSRKLELVLELTGGLDADVEKASELFRAG